MPTVRISKRTVDAAQPEERDVFLWDDELKGFGCKITPQGGRTYVFQFRMDGRASKTRRWTIGRHGSPWTPAMARAEAERLAVLVAQGIDPVAEGKERQRETVELAFGTYADAFLDRYCAVEWRASYANAESALRLHIRPVLRDKPLPAITRRDVTEVLERIGPDRPGLRTGVYAVLRRLFRWAVERGDIERSPLEGLQAPKGAKARDRVLADWELAVVWQAAGELGYPFDGLVRVLIATGQRREEVAGLQWAELDRETATWTLPAARAKNGEQHIVPLNGLAIAAIDRAADLLVPNRNPGTWPRRGFVFTTTGRTAASGHSRAKDRLDQEVAKLTAKQAETGGLDARDVEPWRIHDLRRTLATGMQRLGVRFEVTEAILNHISGSRSGVAGVYQRHHWTDEKRAALLAWERHIESLLGKPQGSNVRTIRPRRKAAA